MARVENWCLKVFEQSKTDKGVKMRTALSGRKKADGSYGKSMNITVFLNADTKWNPADYSGKSVDVSGNFVHDEWEKDGKSGLNFTIFADTVQEHVWEKKQAGGNEWQ